jgi:hypothetical protein
MADDTICKQETLINAIEVVINHLLDCAGNAEDSNEVDNYMQAVKPLTKALLDCARIDIEQPTKTVCSSNFNDMMAETFADFNLQH